MALSSSLRSSDIGLGSTIIDSDIIEEEEPYDELSEGQPGSYQNNHLCDTMAPHR